MWDGGMFLMLGEGNKKELMVLLLGDEREMVVEALCQFREYPVSDIGDSSVKRC